jgi:hypothetical protein
MIAHLALALSAAVLVHTDDMANAPWFRSLMVPGSQRPLGQPMPCCSGADCANVEMRERDGHFEVFIDRETFPDSKTDANQGHAPNDWVVVPEAAILHGKDNPTGGPVACWYRRGIPCFVEGTQT